MQLSDILTRCWPEAAWEINDNDYATLVWRGPGDKPLLAEIEAREAEALASMRAERVRAERDRRIEAVMWRVERHESETRQGLTPTEDVAALDAYVQVLRDLPDQAGFPWTGPDDSAVPWPVEP